MWVHVSLFLDSFSTSGKKLYCFHLVQAWARAPRWSKTCLGAAGRASARGPDTRAGVPEGPLKACRAPEAPRGAGGWALGSGARPARPGAAGLPGESGGLHLLDELHLLTPRPFCRRPRRWAPARSEPGAQIKGRVQGPLQVPGGLRGVQGFPPLFLGRLVPLPVPEEAGRRRGSACSGEAFWLHLHRLSRSGPRSGATSWRRKEERERGGCASPRVRVDQAVGGWAAAPRGEAFRPARGLVLDQL